MSGIALGVAAVSLTSGLIKEGEANKEAKQLQATRPTLQSSPYIKDQLSLSESELSTGMSGGAKSAYESDLDKSLSTSLSAVLKGGGSVNNVGEIFANDQSGRGRLALMKDNLRLAEIDRVSRSRDAAEQERIQQFQVNQDAPWKDQAQGVAAARQGAENQIWGSIGTAGSALMRESEATKDRNALNNSLSLDGSGGSGATRSSVNPISTPSIPGGNVASPAAGVSRLDPNADKSLLDSLLANPI